jgi:tetratricopeptide (TPR) repeat protein
MDLIFLTRKTVIFFSKVLFRVAGLVLIMLFTGFCKNARIEQQLKVIEAGGSGGSGLAVNYPENGTIFPPEFPAPLFSWADNSGSGMLWHIRIKSEKNGVICKASLSSGEWRPDSLTWEKIKSVSASEPVSFLVAGTRRGLHRSMISSARTSFSFSKDSVGASVFFRAVPLPFGYAVKHVQEIEWYRGSISGGKPQKVLENIPVCANCHSFSANGDIAMDVDYANDKGSYIITQLNDTVALSLDKIITWSDYKREDGAPTYGLLSQISPNGRFVLSTVKDRSVFVPIDNLEYSQLFFPIKGIIAIYNRTSRKFTALPGASDKKFVQSNPNWSPDGNEILFTRTNSYMSSKIEKSESVLLDPEDVKEFTAKQKEFKFDLFRIPFNDGKGGTAVPLEGASGNRKSNYFGRYSPDGKWIVFCQADNFMLLQPDSKLYIMPSGGGTPRLMNCNNDKMNSWHSWSPNSKWLVFSSKERGPYTQLYLTHIDENGIDSPPVFLENLAFGKRAVNIPEFLNNRLPQVTKMTDNFSANALYYNRLATVSIRDKEYNDALISIEKTLKDDSTFYDGYKNKLSLNMILGRSGSREDIRDRMAARRIIDEQILKNPGDPLLLKKRGELRLLMQDYQGALQDGIQIIKLNPGNYSGYELLATLYQKTGKWQEAIESLKKMQELQPDNTQVTYTMSTLYLNLNQQEKAMSLLGNLIAKYPNESSFYLSRAGLFISKGDIPQAKADYDKALSVDPENYACYRERGNFFRNNSSRDPALRDYEKSLSLLEKEEAKNPQNAPLFIAHAEITEITGKVKAALAEYENYLSKWPLNYSVLQKIAQIYFSLKQWQPSINAYSTIIDNFPGDAKVFFRRGIVWQQSGNLQNALNDLNKAIEIEPGEYPYYYFRSRIKDQTGDKIGCVSDLNMAADLLNRVRSTRKLDRAEQEVLNSVNQLLKKN